jgi:hypothetical protein
MTVLVRNSGTVDERRCRARHGALPLFAGA